MDHATRERWFESPDAWRFIALRFVPVVAVLNLIWEILQLPAYRIWTSGSPRFIAFAVVHCTIGDVLIGTTTFAIALIVTRAGPLATWRPGAVAGVATALGVGYTVFSEWLNVEVRRSWAYSDLMPVLPVVGTGLAPLAQWIVIPGLALAIAMKQHRRAARERNDRRAW